MDRGSTDSGDARCADVIHIQQRATGAEPGRQRTEGRDGLLIIVISFPVLQELLALARLVRPARLSRLLRSLRLIPVLVRGLATLGPLIKKRGFGYVTFTQH